MCVVGLVGIGLMMWLMLLEQLMLLLLLDLEPQATRPLLSMLLSQCGEEEDP